MNTPHAIVSLLPVQLRAVVDREANCIEPTACQRQAIAAATNTYQKCPLAYAAIAALAVRAVTVLPHQLSVDLRAHTCAHSSRTHPKAMDEDRIQPEHCRAEILATDNRVRPTHRAQLVCTLTGCEKETEYAPAGQC
jgi:hypothetical protein